MWSFPHITSKDWMAGMPSGLSSGQMSLLLLTLLRPTTCTFRECCMPSRLNSLTFALLLPLPVLYCPSTFCALIVPRARARTYATSTLRARKRVTIATKKTLDKNFMTNNPNKRYHRARVRLAIGGRSQASLIETFVSNDVLGNHQS